SLHTVLTIRFGDTDAVRIVVPHEECNAGTGVDLIELGNGDRLAFADLLAMAPVSTLDPHHADNNLSGSGTIYGGPGDDVLRAPIAIGGSGKDILIAPVGGGELFGGELAWNAAYVLEGSNVVGSLADEGNTYRGGGKAWATAGPDIFEFELGEEGTITDALHDDAYYYNGGLVDLQLLSGER